MNIRKIKIEGEKLKITYGSDFHLDKSTNNFRSLFENENSFDVYIIVGDVCSLRYSKEIYRFLKYVCSRYTYVLYIPGNHEFYSDGKDDYKSTIQKLRLFESFLDNLIVLHDEAVLIENHSVLIYGDVFWSYIPYEKCGQVRKLPIFYSAQDSRIMSNSQFNEMHFRTRSSIEQFDWFCKANKLKFIVVTHYGVNPELSLSNYWLKNNDNSMYYCSNIDEFLKWGSISHWIYAHTGCNKNTKINDTMITSNQYQQKGGVDFNSNVNIII